MVDMLRICLWLLGMVTTGTRRLQDQAQQDFLRSPPRSRQLPTPKKKWRQPGLPPAPEGVPEGFGPQSASS